jgi:hypothetical protein
LGKWAELMRATIGMWLGIALSMLLATGCGTGSDVATASRASALTGKAGVSLTEDQAATYVRAVNLRAGDVPGLVAVGGNRASEMEPLGSLGSMCHVATIPAGGVSPSAIGSPTFQRRQKSVSGATSYLPLEAVSSGVYVMRGAALADREIATIKTAADSPPVATCLQRHLEQVRLQVTNEAGATTGPTGKLIFSHVKVSALRPPVQGIPAYGLRISSDFAIKTPGAKGPSRYYQDFLGFAMGPAVVVLSDTGSPRPFPAASERRLFSLLHNRAEANGYGMAKVARPAGKAATKSQVRKPRNATRQPSAKQPQSFRDLLIAKVVACLHREDVAIPPSDSALLSSTSGIKTRSPRVKAAIGKCRSEL